MSGETGRLTAAAVEQLLAEVRVCGVAKSNQSGDRIIAELSSLRAALAEAQPSEEEIEAVMEGITGLMEHHEIHRGVRQALLMDIRCEIDQLIQVRAASLPPSTSPTKE